MNKMDGKSKDLLKENIKQLKQLFPEVCCEDKIDFDKLKQILGEYVEDDKERYNFTWNGKGRSLRLSQTPSPGTLRPCKEESKDWDSTQNLYIEGDNLEVLKLLQKSYYGKIKMIYIDPPYNTGNDFIYKDDFTQSIESYKKITGQVDEAKNRTTTNSESFGRYHTNWLNMMYPRLRLARNLLENEGIVFISIDDREFTNLKKICDECFGESNFLGVITWTKRTKPINSGVAKYQLQSKIEYVVVYCKGKNSGDTYKFLLNVVGKRIYDFKTEKGMCRLKDIEDSDAGNKNRETMKFPILGVEPGEGKRWKIGKEEAERLISLDKIEIINNKVKVLVYPGDEDDEILEPFWSYFGDKVDSAENGKKELNDLMEKKIGFDTVKPVDLIIELLKHLDKDMLILDFFSGSATTAHAVMQLNAEDGGDRRFIMVQLPEVCGEKTEAYKAGYKNICEIGKERIRRAGEKIKAEVEEENAQLKMGEEPKKIPDIGFRVFKLDSSNLKKWQPDYDDLEKTLLDSIENYVEGRSELDVVYEIILKMGLDLTYPVDELDLNGRKIYSVAFGALMICLDDHITKEIADGMISLYQEYQPELWKVVFKDNGFEDDSAKTNIKEQLKAAGLEEDAFTTI